MKNRLAWACLILASGACGDDDAAGIDFTSPIDSRQHADGAGAADGGVQSHLLASFDVAMGELPEGLTIAGGSPLVGFAPTGKIVRVDGSSVTEWGQIPAPSMTYTT